jgi:hypothetical protein
MLASVGARCENRGSLSGKADELGAAIGRIRCAPDEPVPGQAFDRLRDRALSHAELLSQRGLPERAVLGENSQHLRPS